ncbi:cardiolipin synthase [bacterium A37T11]|nr:cardiolipin synthase [bacterium A37T11]
MDFVHALIGLLKQWYWIPILFVYLGVIITILTENRDPEKTVAWVLVIVFLPILGLVVYYIFGQKFKKERSFRRKNSYEHQRLLASWKRIKPLMDENMEVLAARIGPLSRVFEFLYKEHISSVTLRNRVKLLINGEEKFPALLSALRGARHHIHLEYYIFEQDDIGTEILAILKQKVTEGVQIRLIIDDFGSSSFKKTVDMFRREGVEMLRFLPVNFTSLADSNYRNHRKVAIIDGDTAFVGGINISDRYNNNGKYPLYWRDTSVKIEGFAVNVLQIWFWMDWLFANGPMFDLGEGYLNSSDKEYGDMAVTFAYSDPGSKAAYNMEAMLLAISQAKKSLKLCTPYFIPSDQLTTALQLAASSGVEVELMMPAKGDSFVVQHASFSFLKPLLERGVKVYLYQKGFIHAKTISIDGQMAFIGTVNLDTRSFYINFEISAIVQDEQLCQRLDTQFSLDREQSVLLTLEGWKHRPVITRGFDSLCRLLAPLL